jgi:hypothetical protein
VTQYICMGCGTQQVALRDSRPKRCIKPTCQKGGGFIRPLSEASLALVGMESVTGDRAAALAVSEGESLSARLREPGGDVSAIAGRMERDSPLFFGKGDNPGLFG